jgi:hypothetical protein
VGLSILGLFFPILVLGGAAAFGIAIFRRFSNPAGGVEAGAFQEKLLFEIDRLRVQMQIANERLERLEAGHRALPRGDDHRGLEPGSGREVAEPGD